jgi:hypothetical protein
MNVIEEAERSLHEERKRTKSAILADSDTASSDRGPRLGYYSLRSLNSLSRSTGKSSWLFAA